MKAIAFSDSHAKLENMVQAIEKFKNDVDFIIHLGDHIADVLDLQDMFPEKTFLSVSGNNDFSDLSYEKIVNLGEFRFLFTHGHRYNVNFGIDRLFYRAKEVEADIVLFGHLHKPFILEQDNLLILNPGSISYPRNIDICTFLILDIGDCLEYKFWGIFNDVIREIEEGVFCK